MPGATRAMRDTEPPARSAQLPTPLLRPPMPAHPLAPRTAAGDALSSLVAQVMRLSGLLTAVGDALAEPAGQTMARWQVLAAVERAPRSVADAARVLGLTRQSVQRVADLLVADGLAQYEDNPGHRRAKLVVLTARGRDALHTIQAAQHTWANALGADVGESELRRANAALARLADALVADADDAR